MFFRNRFSKVFGKISKKEFLSKKPIFTKKKYRRAAVCRLARFHDCPNEFCPPVF
jgi:hypothetical protein